MRNSKPYFPDLPKMFYPIQPEENTITATEKQLLHDQKISLTSPGTILKDFQMLLDFIGTQGIEVRVKPKIFYR